MNNIKIQINSDKTVKSILSDSYTSIELNRDVNNITEYNTNSFINSADVFDMERQNTNIYRIHGSIDYLSILNGLDLNYSTLSDFFSNEIILNNGFISQSKNIYNSFDFYLLKPSTGNTKIGNNNDHITYINYYEVIATPNNFNLFKAGYSKNIYKEEKYLFNFNIDFDISTYLNSFNIPITDLYLYYIYKPQNNETIYMTKWDEFTKNKYIESFTPTILNIGDIVYGNKIEYSKHSINEYLNDEQKYYIDTPYDFNILQWVYKPLIPLKLRYFSNEIKRYYISGSTYSEIEKIPYYATDLGGGNMIWKEILPQGYIDPLTGIGVNYPFINKCRYLYKNIILSIYPNLNHTNTFNVFKEINFNVPLNIDNIPINDKNINKDKPC